MKEEIQDCKVGERRGANEDGLGLGQDLGGHLVLFFFFLDEMKRKKKKGRSFPTLCLDLRVLFWPKRGLSLCVPKMG
jgi:hypothetical protein